MVDLVALPRASEPRNKHLTIPVTLFTRGWASVLTDGEMAFVLMCARLSNSGAVDGFQASGYTRLMHMGIGPEIYESHRLLSALGIVSITRQPGRMRNGTVPNIGAGRAMPMPDTVRFHPETLDDEALQKTTRAIDLLLA
jgi:hypothetical protein